MKKKISFVLSIALLVAIIAGVTGWATPASAETKWKYQSMWAPSITLWRGDKYFGDLMNILAKGDLSIKFYPGGTLVKKSNQIFDAVQAGSIQMATDWPSYWEGKNTAFSLLTSTPMWLTPGDYLLWYWQAGGLELAQELWQVWPCLVSPLCDCPGVWYALQQTDLQGL